MMNNRSIAEVDKLTFKYFRILRGQKLTELRVNALYQPQLTATYADAISLMVNEGKI